MACVKADRVRSWRESLNPSAPEIPDAGFTVARLILVGMAVAGIVIAFQGIAAKDNGGWSDDELTSAVEGATDALDGSFTHGVSLEADAPADFGGEASARAASSSPGTRTRAGPTPCSAPTPDRSRAVRSPGCAARTRHRKPSPMWPMPWFLSIFTTAPGSGSTVATAALTVWLCS